MKTRCEINKCIRKPTTTCQKCKRNICPKHSIGKFCSDCARHRFMF